MTIRAIKAVQKKFLAWKKLGLNVSIDHVITFRHPPEKKDIIYRLTKIIGGSNHYIPCVIFHGRKKRRHR